MARDKNSFRKLPGRGRKTFGLLSTVRSRLYLEDEHLLCVSNDRFTESYKRFYFRDIQAVVMARTNHATVMSSVFGSVAALFLLLGIMGSAAWNWSVVSWVILGPLAFLFLVFMTINLLKGPTCICKLMTAVTVEELPSLNRVHVAKKVLELLRPTVEAVQGQLTPEELRVKAGELLQAPSSAVTGRRGQLSPTLERKSEKALYHQLMFLLLLLDGVLAGSNLFYSNISVTLVNSILGLLLLGLTVVGLVRQHGSDIGRGLRGLTWTILGYILALSVFSFGFTIYLTLKYKIPSDNQWEVFRVWTEEMELGSPVLFWVHALTCVLSLVFGLAGLVLVRAHRRRAKAPAAPPPLFPSPGKPGIMA